MKMPRTVSLFLVLVLSASPTLGQPSGGSVSGSVVDERGSPMPDASVQMIAHGSALLRYGDTTDLQGRFAFENVRAATYQILVSYVGYGSIQTEVTVGNSAIKGVKITLSSVAVPYPEIVVSAGRAIRALSPVTFTNISAHELSRQPDMKDLPMLLARQPSITFHSENGNAIGYSTLRMRGFGQRRLAVSINGIPQNDPEESNVFWVNFFDIQGAVQDIQIQRGAGSSMFGSTAIGGSINIRAMPYKPDFQANIHVGGGAFGTRRYSADVNSGLLRDRYVVYARGSRLLSDGYREWSWTQFWRFFAGITRYGDRSTLTLQTYGGPQRDGLAYSGIPKSANKRSIDDGFGGTIDRKYNFSAFAKDTENFHQPHVELHHERDLSAALQFSQTLFWVKGVGYFDFGGSFRSPQYLRLPSDFVPVEERNTPLFISRPDVGVLFRAYLDQWQVGWMPRLRIQSGRATTTVGAEARLHRSLRWGRIQQGNGIPAELVGSENDVRVYSFRGEKIIASTYVSHLNRLSDLWAVQADAQLTYRRYRVWDEKFFGTSFTKPYLFFNPRIGMTYRPEQSVSAYASIALTAREPRMKSLYDGEEAGSGFVPQFSRNKDGSLNTDDAVVKAEHLVDFEIGMSWTGQSYRTSLNLFVMEFRDEIVPSGGLDQFGVPRTGNAKRTQHVGLELDGAVRLARGLDVAGNLTLSRNRFKSFEEFVTQPDFSSLGIDRSGNHIAGFPDRSGNIRLDYVRSGFSGSLMGTLVGKQYVDNSDGRGAQGKWRDDLVLESFVLLDAAFSYTFSKDGPVPGLRLSVDVNNVLNDKVLTYGNVSFGSAQFFPAATRHMFFSARYTFR